MPDICSMVQALRQSLGQWPAEQCRAREALRFIRTHDGNVRLLQAGKFADDKELQRRILGPDARQFEHATALAARFVEFEAGITEQGRAVAVWADAHGLDPTPLALFLSRRDVALLADAVRLVERVGVRCQAAAASVLDLDQINDRTAYIPAKDCRNTRIRTHKQLKALLAREPGIRHEYRGQHLYVHAGDWHRWDGAEAEREWEAAGRVEAQVVEAVAAMRAEKAAKKSRKK